ncbi:MAG: MBL fold metallo-hydrolase [Deltaproteobacteria bacterium]|nr:MBL fold metallo-hydrolase [Deltaproteobacteria bacterium]
MLTKIKWLGHSSVKIEAGKIIYIDPWKIKMGQKADLILISHTHHDHLSPADIKKIQKEETVIIASSDAASHLSGDVRVLKPGQEVTVHGITVQAIPAYNIGKAYHPKASQWIGFLLTVEGKTIYYGGDTDLIPEMQRIRADIVILPVGGTYTMTAKEAAEAVNLIRPEVAIPIHYGDIVGTLEDAIQFKGLCKIPVEIKPVSSV